MSTSARAVLAAIASGLLMEGTVATSALHMDHPDFTGLGFGEGAAQFNLFMLPDSANSGAVCLDGTPVGFYFQPGSGLDAYNWMVYFQGGGWCYDPADCYGRSLTTLGSSKNWATTASGDGMMSNDCSLNPQFCNWNKVFMIYCDGNSFSGMRDQPLDYYGHPLYFRGRYNIDAIMAAVAANVMKAPQPWSNAFDIVLTGCSAGGLATYLHADYFAQKYVAANRPPPPGGPSRLGGFWVLPISGFFLDHPNIDGAPVYSDQIQVIFGMANSSYGVNEACIQNEPLSWHCNMAQYTYKYIKSPIFALNSAYDSWQTGCILTAEPVVNPNNTAANGNCSAVPGWAACSQNPESCSSAQMGPYNEFRASFITDMNSTSTAQTTGNGGFINSCHTHCEAQSSAWGSFAINGVVMRDAVARWMASSGPAAANFYWDCQYNANSSPHNCNPTCTA